MAIVKVYHNTDMGAMLDGYTHGDVCTLQGILALPNVEDLGGTEHVLERAFSCLNADDRPAPFDKVRSLSVGDVLEYENKLYSVEIIGFAELAAPIGGQQHAE